MTENALKGTNSTNTSPSISLNLSLNERIRMSERTERILSCRICLVEVRESEKQRSGLISPCLCTGSVQFVHQACLTYWLNSLVLRNL